MEGQVVISQKELVRFVRLQGMVKHRKDQLLAALSQGATVEPGMLKASVALGSDKSTSWHSLALALGATPAQVAEHTKPTERSRSLSVGLDK
jgi:hypothetical protein